MLVRPAAVSIRSTASATVLSFALSLPIGTALSAPVDVLKPPAYPYLPNCPLREDNISDIEVREIQRLALARNSDAVVNIGGVVAGCACEEGASCVAQIAIVAYTPARSDRLILSRVDGHWRWSQLQQWWFEDEALQARYREASGTPQEIRETRMTLSEEREQLLKRAPRCGSADGKLRASPPRCTVTSP